MDQDKDKEKPAEKPPTKLDKLKQYVFDPSEELYYKWLIVISIAVLYNYLFIVGRSSFELLQKFNPLLWFVLDCVCDFIYLLDIFVRLRTGFLEQGILLKDCQKLALTYLKSIQFRLDILSLVPLELLALFFIGYRTECRFNRLIRINRLFECRIKIETRTNFPYLFRILYLVLLIVILIHWNGCFYFVISKKIGIGVDKWVFNNTVANPNNLLFQYVSCFFWSTLMLTTIGEVENPTTNLESLVMAVEFLIAIVLVATLVGNIGSVISNMTIEQDRFQRRVDAIKSLMKLRKVSYELDNRVVKWFDYLHKNDQTLDESEILANVPEKLAIEIASFVHLETLRNINIFSDCEEGLLRELVTKLKVQVFSPGDYVCRKGDIGKEMYIIKRGCLDVVSEDGTKVFVTLKAGAFFGEISILNIPGNKIGNRRTANVRSVGYSELLSLSKNDLWEALADYTANRKMIIEKGKAKLRKDNLLEEVEEEVEDLNEVMTNEQGEIIEIPFSKSKPSRKLEIIEKEYDDLEKKLDKILAEFNENCSIIKKESKAPKIFMIKKSELGSSIFVKI